MNLKLKHFVVFITFVFFGSCVKSPQKLSKIEVDCILVNDSIRPEDSIDAYITPYRNRVNKVLDSALAYAPLKITKEDGRYNSSEGNLLADIVYSEANPIFKSRTGTEIDFVLLNHGGMRSIISKGEVTARHAYEIMPFENTIVVAGLSGKTVRDLISFLIQDGRPHPISGLQIILDSKGRLQTITVQGKSLNEHQIYQVATSSYLVTGGDKMYFFKEAIEITNTDYLIRNAIIDYFKKVDTLQPVVDDRFYKLQ